MLCRRRRPLGRCRWRPNLQFEHALGHAHLAIVGVRGPLGADGRLVRSQHTHVDHMRSFGGTHVRRLQSFHGQLVGQILDVVDAAILSSGQRRDGHGSTSIVFHLVAVSERFQAVHVVAPLQGQAANAALQRHRRGAYSGVQTDRLDGDASRVGHGALERGGQGAAAGQLDGEGVPGCHDDGTHLQNIAPTGLALHQEIPVG